MENIVQKIKNRVSYLEDQTLYYRYEYMYKDITWFMNELYILQELLHDEENIIENVKNRIITLNSLIEFCCDYKEYGWLIHELTILEEFFCIRESNITKSRFFRHDA